MGKRLTPSDYHEIAKKNGIEWLGPTVHSVDKKTNWQCAYRHKWSTTYDVLRLGAGCPHCAGNAKVTAKDFNELGRRRGYEWLGQLTNSQKKTWWQCPKGHKWEAIYSKIKLGRGCPYCSNSVSKKPEDYHTLANIRGFLWIGPFPQTVDDPSTWQCSNGHQWQAYYGNIKKGIGCPYCSNMARKSPEDYHALANKKNYEWLGPEVNNGRAKTWCSSGSKQSKDSRLTYCHCACSAKMARYAT